MRQFDVCLNKGRGREQAPYLIILQLDFFDPLPTRIVAPILRIAKNAVVSRIMVAVNVEDENLYASIPELFSIERKMLGSVVSNLDQQRDQFIRALDMMITG